MKRILSLILTLTLLVSLSACGGKTANEDNTQTTQSKKEANVDSEFLASEKPLTLSIFYFANAPYKDDYPVMAKVAELTNVTLKGYVSQSSSNNKEAFNLMMAGGPNEVANIVNWDNDEIRKFAAQGAFIPLDELMEHAPHIQAFFEEHPEIKNHVTAPDGHIYSIPYVPDGDAAQGWFIRQDWLDKLGLKAPTTIDELHDVLVAFREKDPNGNGKKDEVPYFNRDNHPNRVLADFVRLWGANEWFYVDKDGQVKYGPYEPAYKEAYKNIAQWYKEGLIDQELYTRGKKARDIMLKDNLGGLTHDWFASTSKYNGNPDMVEGFKFMAIAPPADIDGNVIERTVRDKLYWSGWGITSKNPDPVATMKFFDFFFTETGRRLANFGIEGETYDMVDGKPVFKKEILEDQEPVLRLREYGCQLSIGVQQDFEYEKQIMNQYALEGVKLYIDNDYFGPQFPKLKYTEEENDKFSNLMASIDTLKQETTQKWVLGSESVEEGYNNYKEQMKKFGIEEVLKIQQAAYDRYMENLKK